MNKRTITIEITANDKLGDRIDNVIDMFQLREYLTDDAWLYLFGRFHKEYDVKMNFTDNTNGKVEHYVPEKNYC